MKPLHFLLASLVLSVAAARLPAQTDTPVVVAPGVTGAWLRPAGPWDGRAVFFYHGLADDMDGAGDLTKSMARALASQGIASLRINFRGEGDRKRTDIQSTFDTRIADAEAAYQFALKQPGVSPRHLGAIGWSLGAATAIRVAGLHPGWFRTLVVLSSPSGDFYAYLAATPAGVQALKSGVGSTEAPGWKTYTTTRAFYESFRGVDLCRALRPYKGAFLTVRGTDDFLPHDDEALVKAATGPRSEAVLIGGADHIFRVFDRNAGLAERATGLAAQWLKETL